MLDRIVAATRKRIAALDGAALRTLAESTVPARSFAAALAAPGLAVIAEIKRRSPSRGDLAPSLDPSAHSRAYAAGGAAAMSVLTDEEFFGGSLSDLAAVRAAVDLPILRKDFILASSQIWESRAFGADAVLLIVAVLSDDLLKSLLAEAAEAKLEALVEVHNEEEAKRAIAAGAAVVGVNNRDLTTFEVDLGVAERLAPILTGKAVLVAESGIRDSSHAAAMAGAGYHAILVGEALVAADDPAALVASMRSAAP